MPGMDSAMFGQPSDIADSDITNFEVDNIGEAVTDALAGQGWNGEPVGTVLLQLSPDNERVAAGNFCARGRDEREFKIRAEKAWLDADLSVTVTIRMPELDSFSFSDGGLTSDWLQDEEVVHYFHVTQEDGTARPILTPNLEEWGIGKFCLRLVCFPAKACSRKKGVVLKYFLMMYPASKTELTQMSPHTRSGSWPGLKLGEGEMAVLPRPSAPWGCPIVALLKPAVEFAQLAKAPSAAALRHAIACIMRRCGMPDVSRGATSLTSKWERFRTAPASFTTKEVPLVWPLPERPATAPGNT